MERLNGAWEKLNLGMAYFASFITFGGMLLVVTDVGLRYLFSAPIVWSCDIEKILLLYIAFLPLGWVEIRGQHVVIDVLVRALKGKSLIWQQAVMSFLSMGYWLIFAYLSGKVCLVKLREGSFFFGAVYIPQFPAYLAFSLGGLLLALCLAAKTVSAMRGVAEAYKL
jgi:TRAP-type C4-dicarboxylate transport system permease small subunit